MNDIYITPGMVPLNQLAQGYRMEDFNQRRNANVLFRGKSIYDLTREEAIEALHQAIEQIKALKP